MPLYLCSHAASKKRFSWSLETIGSPVLSSRITRSWTGEASWSMSSVRRATRGKMAGPEVASMFVYAEASYLPVVQHCSLFYVSCYFFTALRE